MSSDRAVAMPLAAMRAEPFVYPQVPELSGPFTGGRSEGGCPIPPLWQIPTDLPAKGGIAEEEVRAREERAYEKGRVEGEAQARRQAEGEGAALRGELARALEAFQGERVQYFRRVESDVVQLAMAIARKILHRESQLDPRLLSGLVRVELEKVERGTAVRLRVHSGGMEAWQKTMENQTPGEVRVELLPDDSLHAGQCVMETALGTADLSLDAQLKEIEQGFFDLLAQRPGDTR